MTQFDDVFMKCPLYRRVDKRERTIVCEGYLGKDSVPPENNFESNFRRAGDADKLKMLMELAGELPPDKKKELAEWLMK